jgi:hypothetical protein
MSFSTGTNGRLPRAFPGINTENESNRQCINKTTKNKKQQDRNSETQLAAIKDRRMLYLGRDPNDRKD